MKQKTVKNVHRGHRLYLCRAINILLRAEVLGYLHAALAVAGCMLSAVLHVQEEITLTTYYLLLKQVIRDRRV